MTARVIIAGSGGQGIMLLGKILAEAAMNEGRFVTWLPSYGAEVRGGTAHCMVTISDREIGSAYVDKADVLIIMNAPSMQRMKMRLKKKGFLIVNSSLAKAFAQKGAQAMEQPFTGIACGLGNIRVANMLALGYLTGLCRVVKPESLRKAIREIAPEDKRDLIAINLAALEEGMRLAGDEKC